MNPYSGSEVIRYSSSNGNDVVFIGQGRYTRMNTINADNRGEECQKIEFDNCLFQDEQFLYDIIIFLRPTTKNVQAHMDLIFKNYSYNNKSVAYEYIVGYNIPLDKDNLRQDQYYYDSLQINNTMQYEVYAAVPDPYKSCQGLYIKDTIIEPIKFYYNIHNGLVKVDFDDGSTWELKEITQSNSQARIFSDGLFHTSISVSALHPIKSCRA